MTEWFFLHRSTEPGRWRYVRHPRQHLWVGPLGDGAASPRSIVSTWMIGTDGWPGVILPIFFVFFCLGVWGYDGDLLLFFSFFFGGG